MSKNYIEEDDDKSEIQVTQENLEPSIKNLVIDYLNIGRNNLDSYINEDRETIRNLVTLLMDKTYNATEDEVKNHEEINEQLYMIRILLEKILKKLMIE